MHRRFVRSSFPGLVTLPGVAQAITFVIVLLGAMVSWAPVHAGEPHAEARPTVRELRMAGDATRTRALLQLDRDAGFRWFLLRDPHRLVIDIPQASFEITADQAQPRGLVSKVQYGHLDETVSRMIFSSDGPFAVESIDLLENETSGGHRLVVDLVAASQSDFESALAEQIASTASTRTTQRSDRIGEPRDLGLRPFTVVIDPGHGGIDSGAEGGSGTKEKTITLAFALELRKALEDTGKFRVALTRDRDIFLTLDERVRIARQENADLLISIHADSIRLRGVKGATVYTVSDQASDAEAAAMALRENLSDEIAGIQIEEDKGEVADILVDLIRRETHRFSMTFARTLVGELTDRITLINNPHRFAGFRVLKAPDVPSVLLELGYLSNKEDEAKLRDPEWRAEAIDSVRAAIGLFARSRRNIGG